MVKFNCSITWQASTTKKRFSLSYGFVACLFPLSLLAASPAALDEQPILVQSDSASYDIDANTAKHTGQVLMTQGARALKSDELIVERNENGDVVLCIASGRPATYSGTLDINKPPVLGQADQIRYQPDTDTLILTGNAVLIQDNYQFKGANLVYDLQLKQIVSEKSDESRPTIVIQPKANG